MKRSEHGAFHAVAKDEVGQGFAAQGAALGVFHVADGVVQARAAGAVGRFQGGQPLGVFEEFGAECAVGLGLPGFAVVEQRAAVVVDGEDEREGEEEDEAEQRVVQEYAEAGGDGGENGADEHEADGEGVVVYVVHGAGEQGVDFAATPPVEGLQGQAAQFVA